MLSKFKNSPLLIKISLISVLVVLILQPIFWPGGFGIGKGESVLTKTIEKDAQGKTVKIIETIKYDDGKTLWDWGSLLVVPLILVILGYVLQQKQQERADNETKEEVLQTYFDRLSGLLIDRNLIALSNKANSPKITPILLSNNSKSSTITPEEQELLDSSLDVIRARTLSILRRFENDVERKTSVINFLIETEIIGKAKLNLSGANLSGANLFRVNLFRVNLFGANLFGANLSGAILSEAVLYRAVLYRANLSGANLFRANLFRANLYETNLYGAILSKAYLSKAILCGANLFKTSLSKAILHRANLEEANLEGANLKGANLTGANLEGANLDEANLNGAELQDIKWNSETVWPDKIAFTDAKNIPENLKKELGITP